MLHARRTSNMLQLYATTLGAAVAQLKRFETLLVEGKHVGLLDYRSMQCKGLQHIAEEAL